LEGEEQRAIFRQIAFDTLFEGGIETTAGDVLARIENASVEQRREIVDKARTSAGLETIAEIEKRRELVEATRWPPPPPPPSGPQRDEYGRAILECAAEDCSEVARDPSGFPTLSNATRFWCPKHRHLAEPGDDEPFRDWVRLDAAGRPRMRPEAEAHYARVYEREAAKWRAHRAAKKREAEKLERLRAEYLEAHPPKPPAWFGPPQGTV
jgi:hypothetical protein